MGTLEIVVLAVVVLVVLLALGGVVANARRRRVVEVDFAQQVEAANAQLAAAAADDRGWAREILEAAARDAWEREHPGEEILELALVEVTDRPGTEQDAALFQVTGREHAGRVALARRGDAWQPAGDRM